ncbi:hypothetical protein ACRTDM_20410 [Shewanella algae]|uniref:hypothetical protein n=1 Tax=Shewanella algae TaxID=38313 RepID=UPI000D14F84E|nr:hypothetical protein [Shewanella algae]PST68906.1 hypothetical protein AYI77_02065 [Shewanella algae]
MIMTITPATAKQRKEFRLLVSLRFACLMAATENPMDCSRVQERINQLRNYLHYENASQVFYEQFVGRFGELGHTHSMHISNDGNKVTVRKRQLDNVLTAPAAIWGRKSGDCYAPV